VGTNKEQKPPMARKKTRMGSEARRQFPENETTIGYRRIKWSTALAGKKGTENGRDDMQVEGTTSEIVYHWR